MFPNTATLIGGTTVNITGSNFGPAENGPTIIVTIGNYICDNVTVYTNTLLSCVTPSITFGMYNITVSVDDVTTTLSNVYRSIEPPIIDITPGSTYRFLPTRVHEHHWQ